ncbi:uracil-DNA glycosylase [Sphingomonas sp. NFX23]
MQSVRGGTPLTPSEVIDTLASLHFEDVFNPYADVCPHHDLPNAPEIRRANLLATFEVAARGVDELWIALEPGHKGARRTGLAMTDDHRLARHADRWNVPVQRATRDGPEKEQTAGIVWEALARTPKSVLLWNVFPLHCHAAGRPLSNRRHTKAERRACAALTGSIIEMVGPRRIFAIGRDAQEAMIDVLPPSIPVRHPSYGGKAEFLAGIGVP